MKLYKILLDLAIFQFDKYRQKVEMGITYTAHV